MGSDDDDFSDLTDISDDEYGAPSSRKKKKQPPEGGYRIRNALKVPRASTYTAQALYDAMHSDDIKLDPEYQRDVVWPDAKMVGLIDSVFRNFYIPPVIFAVVSFDDGTEKKICIDGKQRLTSIQRFMDGLIPHKDPVTNEKLWYTDTGGGASKTRRKLLPEKYRRLFAMKQIVCVEYQDLTDSDEREIFQRVQLGMALTPAEKLQVTNTPRASFVRQLVNHFLSPSASSSSTDGAGSLASFDWDRARGADFRCLSQVVFCLYAHTYGPASSTAGSIARLEKFLAEKTRFPEAFEARVRATLRVMGELAADRQALGGKSKEAVLVKEVFRVPAKVSPVEFVMVGLLVGVHMEGAGCSVEGAAKDREKDKEREREGRRRLAEGILAMRIEVRAEHVDIRMNDRVARTMVDFIKAWKPSGDSSEAGAKRKRGEGTGEGKATVEDSGDEEEAPRKVKKTVAPPSKSSSSSNNVAVAKALPLPPRPAAVVPPAARGDDRMAVLRAAKMHAQSQSGGSVGPSGVQGQGGDQGDRRASWAGGGSGQRQQDSGWPSRR
ncbi:hypothetical protein H0H81_010045 [Sphagnurus paluster]|uniref:GmrSD restriction endonucleases N-terminal domain-containing protein n=1 Tax=Sphagnurus paluster TaxID=117069 RepID=A0A9P7FV33_9AGAR|nr:hypothetical protein H0H81_010045 [Sphagnurus paluster]